MTTVLCTGDRNWRDESTVRAALAELAPGDRVIVGDNGITLPYPDGRALDALVHRLALERGDLVVDPPYVADWATHGKKAGPMRNVRMLDQRPDAVWAFHDDLEHSKGTRNCVQQARGRGIPVRLFRSQAPAGAGA